MFRWLAEFDQIIVTGPQRSGTRICAHMIAIDTGYHFIDEIDFGVDSLYKLTALLTQSSRVVVQCPALCRYTHHLAHERMAVIMMRRAVEEIAASQRRINWTHDQVELMRYDKAEGTVAQVKYDFWDKHQVHRIPHAFEISYESLRQHPLWIPPKARGEFAAGQISAQITDEAYLYHSPDVMSVPVEEDPARMRLQRRGVIRQLNEMGATVWNMRNGTRTQAEIIQEIAAQFVGDVSLGQSREDISAFIKELLHAEFLRVSFNRLNIAFPD